jgi:hypothetical protein
MIFGLHLRQVVLGQRGLGTFYIRRGELVDDFFALPRRDVFSEFQGYTARCPKIIMERRCLG